MRWCRLAFLGLLIWWLPAQAWAMCEVLTSPPTYTNGTTLSGPPCGATGGQFSDLRTLLAGEDQTNNVLRVEGQFSRQSDVTSDTLVKTGSGLLHTLTCASDAAATAGTLAVRDSTTAGAGTIMQQLEFVASYFPPVTLTFDYAFTTGLYLDFTTTADVHCSVSYR